MIRSFFGKYRFLSNFWIVPAWYDGWEYPSSEHAFQAAKTLDWDERHKIRMASGPKEAKQLGGPPEKGGIVTLRPNWDQIKIQVMEDIVRDKFTRNPDLRARLLATGEVGLIEGNWWGDTFWGECKGRGENHLGRILMKIRKELGEME